MKTIKVTSKKLVNLGSAIMLVAANQSLAEIMLEEVVVTATKRGEIALQDVAGSIQAIGGDLLQRTGAEGLEDYIKLVPGLSSVSSGTGQSQIVLRGVNSGRITHTQPQANGTSAVYINEVPVSSTGFNPDLNLFDLARVEVLRGPQGTLYGASSMAGAIRLITNRPNTEQVEGKINLSGSSTQDGDASYGAKGLINVPLSDNLALRAVGYTTHMGGYIDNVAMGNRESDYNEDDTVGGRISLGYMGDNLSVIGTVMYNDLEAAGRPDEYIRSTSPGLLADVNSDLQTVKFVDDSFDDNLVIYNITVEYDFENVNLTSSTTISDRELDNTLDDTFRILTLLPVTQADVPFVEFFNETETESLVHESRFTSTNDSPLRWIVGLYYQNDEKSFDQGTDAPGFDDAVGVFGIPPSQVFGATLPNQIFQGFQDIDTEQSALFGELVYDITEQLELTVGLRWFDYEVDVNIRAAGIANGGATLVADTVEEDGINGKAKLTYRLSDDKLVYIEYAEGFRVGGVGGFVPTGPGGLCEGEDSFKPFYESDELTSIEVGAKTSWMDNRLIANAAIYSIDWKDIQGDQFLACGFSFTSNAGELKSQGLEIELAYQVTDALSFRFGGSYIDTKVEEAVAGFNEKGDEAPYVPSLSVSSSLEYGADIFSGYGFLRGDLRYVDSSHSEFAGNSLELPSYTIIDLTMGYEQENWELSLFAKNLFDKRVITNIDPDRNQPPQFSRARPRTVGVSLTRNF